MKRAVGDISGTAVCLNNLGCVLMQEGDLERADTLLSESLALYRELGDRDGTAMALHNLGGLAIERGELTRARSILTETLATFVELGDRPGVAYSMENLAQIATRQGEWRRAAGLFGAGDALRQRIDAPLPPKERADYAASYALGQAALGLEGFAAAWAAGAARSVEEAIELAMAEQPSDPASIGHRVGRR